MDYVNLGRSGLKVSRIGLGCMGFGTPAWRDWVLDEEASRAVIRRAIELGVNFFDTADMYSLGVSEEVVGRALRDFTSREQAVIATKVFFPSGSGPNDHGLSRKHIFDAIDASLRRLGTDYVDLYQIHRMDPLTPIEETLRALDDLVRAGKVRYLGASSCFAWEFAQALALADREGLARFVSMQNHYNLIYREEEREMIPLCRKEGVGVIPWSPLARGILASTVRLKGSEETIRARTDDLARQWYDRETDFEVAGRCREVALRRGVPPAQIALAWLIRQGVTAPIIGATRVKSLDEAVGALDVTLDDAEASSLEELYQPHTVLGMGR